MLLRTTAIALLLCGTLLASPALAGDPDGVRLIAHPGVPDLSCSEDDAQRIFLGKKTSWGDGLRIVPVMLKDGETHEIFVEEILDRSVAKFEIYWKQAVFTGRGIPPRAFESETSLMAYVAGTPGAVGYVSDALVLRGVKELDCR